MTTIPELIADIRSDLQDASESNPRWSDETLYRWIIDASADYSTHFPYRQDRVTLVLDDDGLAYVLPTDMICEIFVECPQDSYLEKRRTRPGSIYKETISPQFYYIDGGRLYLSAASEDAVLLTYYSVHPVPPLIVEPEEEEEPEEPEDLTVPNRDIELIRLYVCGKAHAQMRAKQARLDRFDIGSGRRDDNPLTPEVTNEMQEYLQKINDRKKPGVITLYRSRSG